MAKKKFLSAKDILEAQDLPEEDVEVPEWGGWVRVRALSGAERDAFEASLIEQRGRKVRTNMANARAKFVAEVCIDQDGKRIFTPADLDELGRKSAAGLDRVFSVGQRLSGMRDEDFQELTENFTPGPNGGSISD